MIVVLMSDKYVILFFSAILLVSGQSLWKMAATQMGDFDHSWMFAYKLLFNFSFVSGCLFYLLATALWIYLLGQCDFSMIYPVFVGFCMILSLLAGYLFFKEQHDILRKIIGSTTILLGIYVLVR